MKVPYSWTDDRLNTVRDYRRKGLNRSQIAKLMDIEVAQAAEGIQIAQRELRAKAWTENNTLDLVTHFNKGLSFEDISKLLDKDVRAVKLRVKRIRDDWVLEGTKFSYLNNDARVRLVQRLNRIIGPKTTTVGSTASVSKRPIKMARAKLPDKIRSKEIAGLAETLAYKENVLLDEWWQFGVLNEIEDARLSLTAISKDNNRVTLIKKYTPNWKEVLLKLKGLMGEFVSVRVIQNYLPIVNAGAGTKKDVVYEPRMVDVTASEGIMSLAKSFPSDTRNQSFIGRYKWVRFGEYEAKSTSEHILIGNPAGEVMAFRKGSINHVLENRLMNTLDMAEGQSILVCVDQKNPKPDGVLNAFVDAHIEEEGIETYNEDYSTIIETIAHTKDEAAKVTQEFMGREEEISKQLEGKKLLFEERIQLLVAEAETEQKEIQNQLTEQSKKLSLFQHELEKELEDYNDQERFLRDTKEGLQQYKVDVLAAAADKVETGGTFAMKGLKVIQDKPTFRSDLDKVIQSIDKSSADNVEEMQEALLALKKELKAQHHAAVAAKEVDDTLSSSEEDEGFEPPEPDYIPEADLSLFDEKKPDDDNPMMAMMREILENQNALKTTMQSSMAANAMTDFEVQELRDFVRAEEDEKEEASAKTEAEHKDILDNVREFVGKPARQMKVYQGHARNTLCLRAGIDLTKEKPDDRIEVQFTKHISKSTFRVHFPRYDHDAMLTIVRDSKDKNDFAVKTCLHLDGERWKAAEEEVTGLGGKRLTGKKPKQWLAYRKQIIAKLEAPIAKKKARG